MALFFLVTFQSYAEQVFVQLKLSGFSALTDAANGIVELLAKLDDNEYTNSK